MVTTRWGTAATLGSCVIRTMVRPSWLRTRSNDSTSRLDAESSISGGPLSHNRASIVAITPPNQFPQAVWDELVRQGKLKKAGHGTYELLAE